MFKFLRLLKPKDKIKKALECESKDATPVSGLSERLRKLLLESDVDSVLENAVYKRLVINVYSSDISYLLGSISSGYKPGNFLIAVTLYDYFSGVQIPCSVCLERLLSMMGQDKLATSTRVDITAIVDAFEELQQLIKE